MATKSDWDFSNYVHEHIAIPKIYSALGWTDIKYSLDADINMGIDYFAKNENGHEISIQERFRENSYGAIYNDFTIRYRRDANRDLSRHASEFFKMKADYFLYGITNGKKDVAFRNSLTDFIKYVVVDLSVLMRKFDEGKIKIPPSPMRSPINHNDGTITIERRQNPDYSSDFIALDVPLLHKIFGADGIIICQKGFF